MLGNRGFPEARSRLCVCSASFLMTFAIVGVPHTGSLHASNTGDLGSIPSSGRFLGGRYSHPLKYSCLENPGGLQSTGTQRVRHN